jgi:diaminohydroxyphosphoribosylaminopyrimidine deaminase/5-amino-6-(5-phosphoribosylamino)uracil reductase
MSEHERYMRRALQLAALGRRAVSPNPMVGCVVVHDGRIIGEGFHQRYGQAHAEVNAIASVADASLLPMATAYVTLEPCSHFGKTPPCADLLLRHRIPEVHVCNLDPNPLVAGNGLRKLRQGGIRVEEGLLAPEGRWLNRRFFTCMEAKRPYVMLKWAQTADGFLAREDYDSKWISNWLSRKAVHRWRAQEDAIMVGTNTALFDDPELTVRSWHGPHPLRVVLDLSGRLPASLRLLDGQVPTVCYTYGPERRKGEAVWQRLHPSEPLLPQVMADLLRRGVQSLLVEGGGQLLQAFLDQGLWDEARVFTAPHAFGKGIAAPCLQAPRIRSLMLEGDRLDYYAPSIPEAHPWDFEG